MTLFVVATHGEFSTGIKQSLTMLVGDPIDFVTITLVPGEGPEDLLRKYGDAVKSSDAEETLFFVDLFGGSPYNAAARFCAGHENMDVVSGVNLPMLIECITKRKRGASLEALVKAAKSAALAGVKSFQEVYSAQRAASAKSDEEEDEL